MGNDMAKMAGISTGPPKNKTGSSVVKKKVEAASKTGVLSLTEHKLERVPQSVVRDLGGAASKLRTLDLSANKLEALPALGSFPKLKSLKVARNRLAALPALGGALVTVDASDNKLGSAALGAALGTALKVEVLNLSGNPLGPGCGPAALAKLVALQTLDVARTNLTALLLFEDARWPNLVEVLADDNDRLSALDAALPLRCPKLRRLSLERCAVGAAGLPEPLLAAAALDRLDLRGCPLTKKQFLALDGCDAFMKKREAARKKDASVCGDYGVCGLD